MSCISCKLSYPNDINFSSKSSEILQKNYEYIIQFTLFKTMLAYIAFELYTCNNIIFEKTCMNISMNLFSLYNILDRVSI